MFLVGLLYLILEKSFIAPVKKDEKGLASQSADGTSRAILGIQVSQHKSMRFGKC